MIHDPAIDYSADMNFTFIILLSEEADFKPDF